MGEELIILGEIILSFLAVVGFVYICNEIIEAFRYGRERCRLPIEISADDYSYEQILLILKAFSSVCNSSAADFLFDKITISAHDEDECEVLAEYLGRYAGFANIYARE